MHEELLGPHLAAAEALLTVAHEHSAAQAAEEAQIAPPASIAAPFL